MPVNVPANLPAISTLIKENIFIMSDVKARSQDIRPLKILLLNLMPEKISTETQFMRVLSNTPLQLEVELLQTATHSSKNTSQQHLTAFYKTFDEVKARKFDGMIITGAPLEHLEFTDVDYWNELCEIMEWSKTNVYSTFHICWAAQAALYYHYGIEKKPLAAKKFGIFSHTVIDKNCPLMRGFDDYFFAPHSRHTEVSLQDVEKESRLEVLSVSEKAGLYIAKSRDNRQVFVTGHSEYDADTLKNEFLRDRAKGLDICVPENYFENDDPSKPPKITWRAHSILLYTNWLNYYVYQETPYDLGAIK